MRIIRIILITFCVLSLHASAQTYETQYRRPVSDVMKDVAQRFGVKFKFDKNVDTVGVKVETEW